MPDDHYEVYALRYGARPGTAANEYYGHALYREDDAPTGLDYFFWVVRNEQRTVLVDCGYDRALAAEEGRYLTNYVNEDALDVLALLGIGPDDVDHILITHMHHDHVGNLARFAAATFSIGRREYEFCSGPLARKELMAKIFDQHAIELLPRLEEEGRLRILEEAGTLFPGIEVSWVGGHAPGQLMAEVETASGRIVLASDSTHYYEEFERDRPFWVFTDLEESYPGYARLRELAEAPATIVVPGHDPAVMERFTAVHPGAVADLCAPLDGGAR